jgi:hypothetical protein
MSRFRLPIAPTLFKEETPMDVVVIARSANRTMTEEVDGASVTRTPDTDNELMGSAIE